MKKITLFFTLSLLASPLLADNSQANQIKNKQKMIVGTAIATGAISTIAATVAIISTIKYGSRVKEGRANMRAVEHEYFPWLQGLFNRKPGPTALHDSTSPWSGMPVKEKMRTYGKWENFAEMHPKIIKHGYITPDTIICTPGDTAIINVPYYIDQNGNEVDARIPDNEKYSFMIGMHHKYGGMWSFTQGSRHMWILENLLHPDENKFDNTYKGYVFKQMVKPAAIKAVASLAIAIMGAVGVVTSGIIAGKNIKKLSSKK